MQKLFASIKGKLEQFIVQRDEIALVVPCRETELLPIIKLLEELDDVTTSEMFWIYTDEFKDPVSYADAVVNTFAAKHGAVALTMREKGMVPWPPLPGSVLKKATPPAQRLRELMIFSRSLLPAPDGFLSVWCFMPTSIADPQAYGDLLAELLEHDFPRPWCHHMRLLFRADPVDRFLPTALSSTPRVAWYAPDLGQERIQRAMEEEALDPDVPLNQRLQQVFLLANIDYAHQRFGDALAKHALLLKYYAGTRDATMAALVLNGIGEVHQRTGSLEQAGRCFEAAIAPAAAARAPSPVLLNIVLNLANLRMGERRWGEAEVYYDAAQNLAVLQRAADAKLRSMENLGVSRYMQGKVKEALLGWHAGAAAAGELQMPERRRSALERLRAHYSQVGDRPGLVGVERELAATVNPQALPD